MARVRPPHALLIVVLLSLLVGFANWAWDGGLGQAAYERVRPDPQGRVIVDASGIEDSEVRYYRFLNAGNQEVKFFVGRDHDGTLQVAFDASESHAQLGRGFRHEGDWMVDNKCDSATRLEHVNEGGHGCRPVPLPHRVEGDRVILAEDDVLRGWRYFR
jgi:uncharacterized membrane protein